MSGVVEHAFCKVCRVHYDTGRRHIFTKKHKERLSAVLLRFKKKVKDARKCLKKPVVEEGEVEPDARIWCYCCEEEVDKHVTDREISVVQGGVLEHMASSDHHKKTRHYWWEHGADVTEQPFFLLHQLDYERYLEAVHLAVEAVEEKIAEKQQKEVAALRQQDIERINLLHSQSSSDIQSQTIGHVATWCSGSERNDTHYHSNASSKSNKRWKGNVHTDAVPPWLRGDADDDETPMIGPSEELFLSHVASKKKSGKNPKRVGAEFIQQMKRMKQDDDSWLPSFGRVWNHGPRSHSKLEFISESGIQRRDKHRKSSSQFHAISNASLQDASQQQSTVGELDTSTSHAFPAAIVHYPLPCHTGYWTDCLLFQANQMKGTCVHNQTCAFTESPVNVNVHPLQDAHCIGSLSLSKSNESEESKETTLTQACLTDSNKLSLLSKMLSQRKQELLESLKRKKGNDP